MTIGDLVVNLGLNRTPFSSGINAARNELAGFGDFTVKKMASIGLGIASGLAAVAGINAFKQLTVDAMEAIDNTGKMAAALGMPVEELVRLRHAAEMAGLAGNEMSSAMTRFSRRMAFGAQGGGAAMGTIKKLKLDAAGLASMDPSQAFRLVSDEINKLPTQAEKMAASFQLFGNSSKEMLDLISLGSDGLLEKMGEADALGKVFSQSDVDQVAAANDAIDRMKGAVTGLAQQMAIFLAPMITSVVDGFRSLAPIAGQVFGFITSTIMTATDMVAWAFANWQEVAQLTFAGAKLGVVAFEAEVVHFFTGVLPSLFSWFGKNWSSIWRTALDLSLTMLINLGENIRNIFSSIWEFIASGGTKSLQLTWKPLTDGFVNTIRSLPEIPKREMGPLEQQLNADFARLGNSAGASLREFLDERNQMRLGTETSFQSSAQGVLQNTAAKGKTTTDKTSGPVGARVDSVEAYKLIQSSGAAQAAARDAYMKKVADKQLKVTQDQTGYLRQIAANTGDDTIEELDY
ncbi:MAG TPA: hypothetical protein VNQ76_14145 [Planctomicrobium sp.]|nr:hypothetical protein [Planctomicrobium sp.]